MAGLALVDDNFTDLADGITISGRVPPVTDTSAAYAVDVGATGGGLGDFKFSGQGAAVKNRSLVSNCAIQILMDDKGGNEAMFLFTRDTANTPYPRYGYIAQIRTRVSGGTNGLFTIFTNNNFVRTALPAITNIPWTFAGSGVNLFALESIGNNHRLIINNVVASSFTDTAFPTDPNATKCGVTFETSASPSVMRVDRFSIYDSIAITVAAAYPIVTVA